jgi:hypothetical protein
LIEKHARREFAADAHAAGCSDWELTIGQRRERLFCGRHGVFPLAESGRSSSKRAKQWIEQISFRRDRRI